MHDDWLSRFRDIELQIFFFFFSNRANIEISRFSDIFTIGILRSHSQTVKRNYFYRCRGSLKLIIPAKNEYFAKYQEFSFFELLFKFFVTTDSPHGFLSHKNVAKTRCE